VRLETEKTINEASLERFLIRKGEVNNASWKQILDHSKGTNSDKALACKLIFQNYRSVPPEADEILKELVTPTQHEDVRKTVASEMAKETVEIPAGLYFDLLGVLAKDPSQEVRDIVESKFKLITEPIAKFAKLWQEYQTNLVSKMTDFVVQYQEAINKSVSRLAKALYELSKFLEEPEFKDFEYNWLIFLPIDVMRQLYEMHKMGKDNKIKQLLLQASKDKEYLGKFNEEMNASSLFKPRIAIIQDAINAHKAGKYSLSIPVFLAQIEGVLWDYAEKQSIAAGTEITEKSGKKIKVTSAKPLVKDTRLRDLISENVATYFLERVYTKDFRHSVLHGRNVDYNKEENSMKLLLFIRALLDACD